MEEEKIIDQTQLAEDLSSKIKYDFKTYFLVKPLEPIKVKTEIKEVDSDYTRAVVLKLPYEYTHPYGGDNVRQFDIKVGDVIIYRSMRGPMYFDLLKDSQLVSIHEIIATEEVVK